MVERRLEALRVPGAHVGVDAVGGEHEVVFGGQLVDVGSVRAEVHGNVQGRSTCLEQLEQTLAGHRGEAVTT